MGTLRKEQVAEARTAGVSDTDIWNRLLEMPDVQKALANGVPGVEIKQYVGIPLNDRETAEVKRQERLAKLKPIIDEIKRLPSQAIKPFKVAAETWGEEARAGSETMARALKGETPWYNLPLGALQYGFSPVTGGARAVGSAVEEAAGPGAGLPPEIAQFLGKMGEEATYFVPPVQIAKGVGLLGKTAKRITPVEEAFKYGLRPEWISKRATKEIAHTKKELIHEAIKGISAKCDGAISLDNVGFNKLDTKFGKSLADSEKLTTKQALAAWNLLKKYKKQIPKDLWDEITKPIGLGDSVKPRTARIIKNEEIPKIFRGDERLLSKGISESLVNDATLGAEQALAGNLEKGRRIFHQIADKLKISEIQIEDLPDILKKYNLTPEQFAQEYENTISRAGRVLAYHSRAAKRLNAVFKDSPEALRILEQAVAREKGTRYASDMLFELWSKFDSPRRALLVSQLATAMRNAFSQAGRLSLGTVDNVMQEVVGGGSTRDSPSRQ